MLRRGKKSSEGRLGGVTGLRITSIWECETKVTTYKALEHKILFESDISKVWQ